MGSHLSQLNALREEGTSAHQVDQAGDVHIVGGIVQPDIPNAIHVPRPRTNLFNYRESKKLQQQWDAANREAFNRNLDLVREIQGFQDACNSESIKNRAACAQLKRDAAIQTDVARALARSRTRAAAKAMHDGKNVSVYATNLIRFIDVAEQDPVIRDDYKSMVRRLAKAAMIDMESAALGTDLDPDTFGG